MDFEDYYEEPICYLCDRYIYDEDELLVFEDGFEHIFCHENCYNEED